MERTVPQESQGIFERWKAWLIAGLKHPRVLGSLIMYCPCRLLETYYVRADSRRILANHKTVLFVDGGANLGQGFSFFASYFPPDRVDFEVFEPNPNCLGPLQRNLSCFTDPAPRIHPVALSTRSGFADLFGTAKSEGGLFSTGASINQYQHSVFYDANPEAAIRVPTIDFCKFLASKSPDYDIIVVKLDIEGAENDLLETLIERDAIRFIDTLYVEFHSSLLKGARRRSERRREARLITRLKKARVHFRRWH